MAEFIVRALRVRVPPQPASQRFADVPPDNPFYAYIDQLAARGITPGCGANPQGQPIFCPKDFVKRDEMAAFLVRAFNLPILPTATPTPTPTPTPTTTPTPKPTAKPSP